MLKELARRLRPVIGPVIGACAVAYFAYHTVEGDRGVLAWVRLKNEILDAEMQLAKVTTERQVLEHRVLLLRPDHLDPDMLEERARAMLNMGREDEMVVFEKR
ncbi:septum formation initiator [Magnetospirillum moscoviense]|uniref:Septum formation initiator n=1 Tax=Magnetospirillum moscoviense TaxID=1437059 RepID=A0A178N166_9PROT|nr:septum formation initiator family protein [Alphaproteobacteria bacterium]OAN64478.1 septum formation initiator [Magnetospirillum moscoviense]CAA7612050.1 putative Septum formation initiator [Magnetospirillum sp. LM-5]